jgi:hypothetical protein
MTQVLGKSIYWDIIPISIDNTMMFALFWTKVRPELVDSANTWSRSRSRQDVQAEAESRAIRENLMTVSLI